MNVEEFISLYVTNQRREELFAGLRIQLSSIMEDSSSIRVIIFGSFLTNREYPGDIDVLVSAVIRHEAVVHYISHDVRRPIRDGVDLYLFRCASFISEAEALVAKFNTNKNNVKHGVLIDRAVEIFDVANLTRAMAQRESITDNLT